MCLITLGSVVACQAVGFPVYIGSCSIFLLKFMCMFISFPIYNLFRYSR